MCVTRVKIAIILPLSLSLSLRTLQRSYFSFLASQSYTFLRTLGHSAWVRARGHSLSLSLCVCSKFSFMKKSVVFTFLLFSSGSWIFYLYTCTYIASSSSSAAPKHTTAKEHYQWMFGVCWLKLSRVVVAFVVILLSWSSPLLVAYTECREKKEGQCDSLLIFIINDITSAQSQCKAAHVE